MELNLIEDKIAFAFLEDIENRTFTGKTESGIIVKRNSETQVKEARWGVVIQCAPNVTETSKGEYILVEPLGWTNGVQFDELSYPLDKFWVTTETRVMAVSKDKPRI